MLSKILALGAFVAAVAAQAASPAAAEPTGCAIGPAPKAYFYGTPGAITYGSTDQTDPITITLMQGPTTNLLPVETLLVTQDGTTGVFNWDPATSPQCLETGQNYALRITQAGQPVNYWGHINVTNPNGCGSQTTSSSASWSSPAPTSTPTWTTAWNGTHHHHGNTTTVVIPTSTTVPCNSTTTGGSGSNGGMPPAPTGVAPANSAFRSGSNLALVLGVFAGLIALN